MILYTQKKQNFLDLIQLSTPRLLYAGEADAVEFRMTRRLAHHHDHLEIMYVFEGSGTIVINGKDHFATIGDLIVYNSHIVHDESYYRPKIGILYLGVSHLHYPGLPPNCITADSTPPIIHCGGMKDYIYQLFQSLINFMELPMPAHETVSNYLMLPILSVTAELSKSMFKQQTFATDASAHSELCQQIKEFISENYTHELTLEMISDAISISPYYMSRIFKKETGYSPMQYVTNLRLGEAQVLLIHTSLPVTTIAQRVGYNNSSAFNYSFRKMFGITPTEFRRLYKI